MIRIVHKDIFDSEQQILAHQVNTEGVMGAGIAKVIKEKYPGVYSLYREECLKKTFDQLMGTIQVFEILPNNSEEKSKKIANLFAQSIERTSKYGCYTDYDALRQCFCILNGIGESVAVPYLIGCGLGGGDWEIVKKIIEEECKDIDVEICSIEPLDEDEAQE